MIFCLGNGSSGRSGEGYHKDLKAWNKCVTENRYNEILKTIRDILSDFKLDAKENWTKEWGKVRDSQWEKIAKIPEFDLEITKKITGLSNINIESEKTIEIEGKKFTVTQLKNIISSAE